MALWYIMLSRPSYPSLPIPAPVMVRYILLFLLLYLMHPYSVSVMGDIDVAARCCLSLHLASVIVGILDMTEVTLKALCRNRESKPGPRVLELSDQPLRSPCFEALQHVMVVVM